MAEDKKDEKKDNSETKQTNQTQATGKVEEAKGKTDETKGKTEEAKGKSGETKPKQENGWLDLSKTTPQEFLKQIKTTKDVFIGEKLVEQVIGQAHGVEIIKKAATQKRNVLLIGYPGTGKSMLAQAMSELLPVQELQDVLIAENPLEENTPKVVIAKAGEGRKSIESERAKTQFSGGNANLMLMVLITISAFLLLSFGRKELGDVITAAMLIGIFVIGGIVMLGAQIGRGKMMFMQGDSTKIIVDNAGKTKAPFIDATGARAGSLLGDVRHDPLQTGGLGTPAHLRVEAGAIHKANKGVLFIDEVAVLSPRAQQELLTAMQEKKYSITGQSELSSGAMVKTEPVPCDFVLVAAGNYKEIQRMHPALRSRIRGYGYEIYMEESIEDNPLNRCKLIQFIAQEVRKDTKIPHFDKSAVDEIIYEARKRSNRKNKLTLKLRELGGLIRAAGDVAREEKTEFVSIQQVQKAKKIARTLEQQAASQVIELKKDYKIFLTIGAQVGKVNGLAVMGDSGVVLPIVAEAAPASSREEGRIIATGKLGEIAKEAVENVSAIIKKHIGKDTSNYDMHIQFLQTYEGVEGDSASVSVATAVISALEEVPVLQTVALTGSLSVRGEVLPVGGITQKVEAAIEAGIKTVIIPESNKDDLALDEKTLSKVTIVPVKDIHDVLKHALKESRKKKELLEKIRKEFNENGNS